MTLQTGEMTDGAMSPKAADREAGSPKAAQDARGIVASLCPRRIRDLACKSDAALAALDPRPDAFRSGLQTGQAAKRHKLGRQYPREDPRCSASQDPVKHRSSQAFADIRVDRVATGDFDRAKERFIERRLRGVRISPTVQVQFDPRVAIVTASRTRDRIGNQAALASEAWPRICPKAQADRAVKQADPVWVSAVDRSEPLYVPHPPRILWWLHIHPRPPSGMHTGPMLRDGDRNEPSGRAAGACQDLPSFRVSRLVLICATKVGQSSSQACSPCRA